MSLPIDDLPKLRDAVLSVLASKWAGVPVGHPSALKACGDRMRPVVAQATEEIVDEIRAYARDPKAYRTPTERLTRDDFHETKPGAFDRDEEATPPASSEPVSGEGALWK